MSDKEFKKLEKLISKKPFMVSKRSSSDKVNVRQRAGFLNSKVICVISYKPTRFNMYYDLYYWERPWFWIKELKRCRDGFVWGHIQCLHFDGWVAMQFMTPAKLCTKRRLKKYVSN